jgi:hypothetical protein
MYTAKRGAVTPRTLIGRYSHTNSDTTRALLVDESCPVEEQLAPRTARQVDQVGVCPLCSLRVTSRLKPHQELYTHKKTASTLRRRGLVSPHHVSMRGSSIPVCQIHCSPNYLVSRNKQSGPCGRGRIPYGPNRGRWGRYLPGLQAL